MLPRPGVMMPERYLGVFLSKREALSATATSGTDCEAAAMMELISPKDASPMTSMVKPTPKKIFWRMVLAVRRPSRMASGT